MPLKSSALLRDSTVRWNGAMAAQTAWTWARRLTLAGCGSPHAGGCRAGSLRRVSAEDARQWNGYCDANHRRHYRADEPFASSAQTTPPRRLLWISFSRIPSDRSPIHRPTCPHCPGGGALTNTVNPPRGSQMTASQTTPRRWPAAADRFCACDNDELRRVGRAGSRRDRSHMNVQVEASTRAAGSVCPMRARVNKPADLSAPGYDPGAPSRPAADRPPSQGARSPRWRWSPPPSAIVMDRNDVKHCEVSCEKPSFRSQTNLSARFALI